MFDVSVRYGFDFRSDDYATLFERSDATAFQHPLWLHHLYAVLAPANGAEPVIIVVRHDDSRLAMVLPLLRRSRGPMSVLEFADLGVSDYVSPVCNRATFSAIMSHEPSFRQLQDILKRFDLMRIEKIRADGLPLERLFGVPADEMPECAHALPLHAPYTEWRTRFMAPGLVREIERKWRQLGRIGTISLDCVVEPGAIDLVLEEMRAFREQRFRKRPGKDLLQDPDYFRFYRNVALDGAAAGFVRLFRMSVNGRTVAADFGLAHRGAFLGLLRGFDDGIYKNRSLGMLATDALLANSVARGDLCFDMTIGDEPYKQLFGAMPTRMLAVATRGTVVGGLAMIAAERLPRVHEVAKRLLGASASLMKFSSPK